MKPYRSTRWFDLIDMTLAMFMLVVVIVIVNVKLWMTERRLEHPDPKVATIARTGPELSKPSDHPYPKRPCQDCVLKHKRGACLTDRTANSR